MRLRYLAPPWVSPELTEEAKELVELLADNTWSEASVRFYAERDAKIRTGQRAPKGMQRTLNSLIEEKLIAAGWDGDSGYFFKNKTWVRFTFRHQMSIGSDFLDAIKVCKKEGFELAIIVAANLDTLRTVTPNDCNALVSFEKLQSEIISLDGALDIPLLVGELSPITSPSQAVSDELAKARPRDITLPKMKKSRASLGRKR